MVRTTTVRRRIGAGFLAVMMLVLTTAAIVVACPAGCCEPDGVLTIGRTMACCEIPSVEEREPASAEPARAATVAFGAPHLALPQSADSIGLDARVAVTTHVPDGGGHHRLHAPPFLVNAQFLI